MGTKGNFLLTQMAPISKKSVLGDKHSSKKCQIFQNFEVPLFSKQNLVLFLSMKNRRDEIHCLLLTTKHNVKLVKNILFILWWEKSCFVSKIIWEGTKLQIIIWIAIVTVYRSWARFLKENGSFTENDWEDQLRRNLK